MPRGGLQNYRYERTLAQFIPDLGVLHYKTNSSVRDAT